MQSTESHANEYVDVADVPGSAASGRNKVHSVETSTVVHIAPDGKHIHGDTVEFVDVTGVEGDGSIGKAI